MIVGGPMDSSSMAGDPLDDGRRTNRTERHLETIEGEPTTFLVQAEARRRIVVIKQPTSEMQRVRGIGVG
jgi:hypothetical protein